MSENGTSKLAQVAKATQVCAGCGKTKPLADFPPHPKTPLGVFKRCEGCLSERQVVVAASRRKAEAEAKELRARARRKEAEQMNTDAKAILDEHNLPALDAALTGEEVTKLYGTAATSLQLGRAERGIEKVGVRDRHFLYSHRSIVEAYRAEKLGKPRVRKGIKNRSAAKIAGYRERISAAVAALEAEEAARRAAEREAAEAERAAQSDSAAPEAPEATRTLAEPTDAGGERTQADAGGSAPDLATLAAEARGMAMFEPRIQQLADKLTRLAEEEAR